MALRMNAPAWIVANPRKRKRRKSKAKRTIIKRRHKARKVSAPKRRRRRKAAAQAAFPTMTKKRRRRRSRKAQAPKVARKRRRRSRGRHHKHTHWGKVMAHSRRVNPRKRRRHLRRRRNPGIVSSVLTPIKENAIGFGIASIANRMAIGPLLASLLPAGNPLVLSAGQLAAGPLIAALGKRFLPKFSRTWDSFALYFVAVGMDGLVSNLFGSMLAPKAATSGLGHMGGTGSIRGTGTMGSIGPTMRGLGGNGYYAQAQVPESPYQAYSEDGSF